MERRAELKRIMREHMALVLKRAGARLKLITTMTMPLLPGP